MPPCRMLGSLERLALHLHCPADMGWAAHKSGVFPTTSQLDVREVNFWGTHEGWVLIRGESAGKVGASTL